MLRRPPINARLLPKSLSAIGLVVLALLAPATSATAGDAARFDFPNGRVPGQGDRVVVELKVVGHGVESGAAGESVKTGEPGGPAPASDDRVDMRVAAQLEYDEWTLAVPDQPGVITRSMRHYHRAEGVLKLGEDGLRPKLRDDRKTVIAQIAPPGTATEHITLFSPEGPLTREELELLRVLGNSLLLDDLAPEGSAAVGDRWAVDERVLARLLDLDTVGHAEVRAELVEITDGAARFQMTGTVDGAVHGAATEVRLKAKFRFNRQRNRIDWFAMVVKERRKASPVGVGLDVTAQVIVQIQPDDDLPTLSAAEIEQMNVAPEPTLTQLEYTPNDGDWQLVHDRRWYVVRDEHDLVVLRMVDRGDFLAQCKLAPLPRVPREKLPTLDEFKRDVAQQLSGQSTQIATADQWGSDRDYRVFRVVAVGEIGQDDRRPDSAKDNPDTAGKAASRDSDTIPVQWRYYLVTDAEGHRAVFAFTLEDKYTPQFGQADGELVAGLRFEKEKGDE